MSILDDYTVNPYAVGAGGLLGAGIGLGAYYLGDKRSLARAATYASIGAALGLSTGALVTLANKDKDPERTAALKKARKLPNSELRDIAGERGTPLVADLASAGVGGLLGERGTTGALNKLRPKDGLKAAAGSYIPEVKAKAEVPFSPAVPAHITVQGKVAKINDPNLDVENISGLSELSREAKVRILGDNGIPTHMYYGRKGELLADKLSEIDNKLTHIMKFHPHKAEVPFQPAVPGAPARYMMGNTDVIALARHLFGDSADLSALSDNQKLALMKALKKAESTGLPWAVINRMLRSGVNSAGAPLTRKDKAKLILQGLTLTSAKPAKALARLVGGLSGTGLGYVLSSRVAPRVADWFE